MRSSKLPQKRPSLQRGVSLVEVLISLVISGIVMFGASEMLRKPQALVETLTQQTQDASLVDIKAARLVTRLENSHVMRRGFFNCNPASPTPQNPLKTLLESTVNFSPAVPAASGFNGSLTFPEDFTIVSSNYASLVAQQQAGTGISVTDVTKYPVGSLLLLTALNVPTIGGVFQVVAADPDTAVLTVSGFPRGDAAGVLPTTIPPEYNCAITASSKTLTAILAAEEARVFGRPSKTLRAEVITFARYFKQNGAQVGSSDLHERVWPSPRAAEFTEEGPVFTDFIEMRMSEASWVRSGGNPTNGRFSGDLILNRRDRQLGSARAKVDRTLERKITYNSNSTGQSNFGAINIPQAATITFPTCGVIVSPLADFVKLNTGEFAQFYRVSQVVGGSAVSAGISLSMTGSGGKSVRCWRDSQISSTTPAGIVDADDTLGNGPMVGAMTLHVGTVGLSSAVCDIPNGSSFTAEMRYFNNDLKQISVTDCSCSGVPTGVQPTFSYKDNIANSCSQATGQINFATLLVSNALVSPNTQVPTLYTDDTSCEWTGSGGFTNCAPDPNRGSLLRVRLRPKNIPGGLPNPAGAPPTLGVENEIACS